LRWLTLDPVPVFRAGRAGHPDVPSKGIRCSSLVPKLATQRTSSWIIQIPASRSLDVLLEVLVVERCRCDSLVALPT
jgi:hypothetical protein